MCSGTFQHHGYLKKSPSVLYCLWPPSFIPMAGSSFRWSPIESQFDIYLLYLIPREKFFDLGVFWSPEFFILRRVVDVGWDTCRPYEVRKTHNIWKFLETIQFFSLIISSPRRIVLETSSGIFRAEYIENFSTFSNKKKIEKFCSLKNRAVKKLPLLSDCF